MARTEQPLHIGLAQVEMVGRDADRDRDLPGLHRFLSQVLDVPYVDSLEQLEIRDNAVAKELRVKLQFALQQG